MSEENPTLSAPRLRMLSQETLVPLGLVAACISAFVGGALWIQSSLGGVEHRLDLMEERINNRLKTLESTTDDRWRRSDMKTWVRELKGLNPSMNVPPID